MTAKILIVDDEPNLLQLIGYAGFVVRLRRAPGPLAQGQRAQSRRAQSNDVSLLGADLCRRSPVVLGVKYLNYGGER